MPVSNTNTFTAATANGVTTVFPYNFTLLSEDDLVVTVAGIVVTTGFTVSGVGDAAGGNVTFTVAPANLARVLLERVVTLTRSTDYQYVGSLASSTLDADFDRLWLAMQQENTGRGLSPALPLNAYPGISLELPSPAANGYWRWNSAGTAIEYVQLDVEAAGAASLKADLANSSDSTKGAALIGFTQSGTGAVAQTAREKMNRALSVMDFIDRSQWALIEAGTSTGQNATLVTAGWQAAINKMISSRRRLDCGYGAFLLNTLTVDGLVDAEFSGEKGSILHLNATAVKIFDVLNSGRFDFVGLKLLGTATADATYREHDLIDIRNNSFFVGVHRCTFSDFARWGVVARLLAGSTYTEGVTVDNCLFVDAPSYHASYAAQAGVAFGADGEYSRITNSQFYRIPSAARFTDGANGLFADNVVMQLNGGSGVLQTDRACIYAELNSNNGKVTIARNKINHNESGLVPIIVKGDLTTPQNPYEVLDNDVLVNGNASVGYQIIAYDSTNIKIRGNKLRPATANVNPCLRLNDCDAALVADNFFRGGSYALENDSSSNAQWASNICESIGTAKVLNSNGGTTINRNNKAFAFRVSSAGAAGTPWDDASWTVSRPATGQFTVVHNMNSTDYSVAITHDAVTTADGPRISVVRAANQFDVYIKDNAGTVTNINFLANVVVGKGNQYAM